MALTVVGTASVDFPASFSTQHISIPLPSGSQVGDLIVVGFWGPHGTTVTDSRLTVSHQAGVPSWDGGAQGVATDLSDVTLDFTAGRAAQALVIVLRGAEGTFYASAFQLATPPDDVVLYFGLLAGHPWAVCIVTDAAVPGIVPPDANADWTTAGSAGPNTDQGIKGYVWASGDPPPELAVDISHNPSRSVYFVMSTDIASDVVTRPWLRQRQSPKANVRVSLLNATRGTQLRARQKHL